MDLSPWQKTIQSWTLVHGKKNHLAMDFSPWHTKNHPTIDFTPCQTKPPF